jgi:uncharacterized ubiquitin-like protein YukD
MLRNNPEEQKLEITHKRNLPSETQILQDKQISDGSSNYIVMKR